jgi:hypothetical protein
MTLLAGCVVDQGKEVQTYRDVLDGIIGRGRGSLESG